MRVLQLGGAKARLLECDPFEHWVLFSFAHAARHS